MCYCANDLFRQGEKDEMLVEEIESKTTSELQKTNLRLRRANSYPLAH